MSDETPHERDPKIERWERAQEDAAAHDAGEVGGRYADAPLADDEDGPIDEATRPLIEAGEGEAEGFEETERELRDNASHGDEHAASRVILDAAGSVDEDDRGGTYGEADAEMSSEYDKED